MSQVFLKVTLLWACVCVGAVAATVSADEANCNQRYSKWFERRDENGQLAYYYCRYYFKPANGKEVMNWVVWYPTENDHKYCYYSNSKGNYWCRALTDVRRNQNQADPRWNVLTTENSKKPRLNEISVDSWSGPVHPICPGSDADGKPGCKMLPPPPLPVELFKKLAAAKN
ncbi:MAG: hypothetical protein ACKO38_07290 [Planctomycetota bacterium]